MNIIQNKSNNTIALLDLVKYKKPHLRKVPKKTNWTTSKLERIFFPCKDEVLRDNGDKFIKWIMKELKGTGKTLGSKQNYNACSLYLSKKNVDDLQDLLDPVTWMNFSPVSTSTIPDNKLGIDMDDVVVNI